MSPVYEVQRENGTGPVRVLHRNLFFQCNDLPIDSDAAPPKTVPVRCIRNHNRNPYRTRSATQIPIRETDVSMSDSSDLEGEIDVALDTESVPHVWSDSIADEKNESANVDSGRLADQRVQEIELQTFMSSPSVQSNKCCQNRRKVFVRSVIGNHQVAYRILRQNNRC